MYIPLVTCLCDDKMQDVKGTAWAAVDFSNINSSKSTMCERLISVPHSDVIFVRQQILH